MSTVLPRHRHLLGATPTKAPRRGRKIVAGVAGGALVLGAAATGATAWAAGVMGRGLEPESIAPASSIAFARLDLNPSLAQKFDFARFARTYTRAEGAAARRPGSDAHTFSGIRDDFIEHLLDGTDGAVPLHSWFAGRAAVAVYPDRAAADGVTAVGIVQYTDRSAMVAVMSHEAATDKDFGYAVDTRDRYVVVADTTAQAQRALAAGLAGPLTGDPTFRSDLASLPEHDDPGIIWADITVSGRASARLAARGLPDSGSGSTTGRADQRLYRAGESRSTDPRLVVGLRLEPAAVDVEGRVLNAPGTAAVTPGAALAGLSRLPSNTVGAVSVSGLGDALGTAYGEAALTSVRGALSTVGIGSAADLEALFGSVTTAAVLPGSAPSDPLLLRLASTTTDPARGLSVARRLESTTGGIPGRHLTISVRGDQVLARTAGAARPASGALSASPAFRAAVPDAAGAGSIGYLDVQQLLTLERGISAKDRAELAPFAALGISTSNTGSAGDVDPGFHLRLTLR